MCVLLVKLNSVTLNNYFFPFNSHSLSVKVHTLLYLLFLNIVYAWLYWTLLNKISILLTSHIDCTVSRQLTDHRTAHRPVSGGVDGEGEGGFCNCGDGAEVSVSGRGGCAGDDSDCCCMIDRVKLQARERESHKRQHHVQELPKIVVNIK